MTLVYLVLGTLWTAATFTAGLLVGKKNPKVADAAQALAGKVDP